MKIAIVGAGAAGCFCAANLRQRLPHAQIDVYERARKPLQKVAITGGGRCNLTNSFREVKSLQQVYPRGYNLMKRLLKAFDHQQTMQWWEDRGVRLVTQDDQCVFPRSQDAMEIVDTLLRCMKGCRILCEQKISDITTLTAQYDAVVVTTGGSPRIDGLSFLSPLGLDVVPPVPSLFTFNLDSPIKELMGVVCEHATTSLAATKFHAEGPLLITHWGMSGPAILKLSSQGAKWLAEQGYKGTLLVNWTGGQNEEAIRQTLKDLLSQNGPKQIGNCPLRLTSRLWHFLLQKSGIDPTRRCAEVGSKQQNRLVNALTADAYPITGQSRFKEEFVTCGGVSLTEVNPSTLECKRFPNLYLAGEVLDVDAITGGFNLQAAWTMGYIVAQSISARQG